MIKKPLLFFLRGGAARGLCCLFSCCLLFSAGCLPDGGERGKSLPTAAAEGTRKEAETEINGDPGAETAPEKDGPEAKAEETVGAADQAGNKNEDASASGTSRDTEEASGIRTVSVKTNTDPGNMTQSAGGQDISAAFAKRAPDPGRGLEGRRLIFNGDSRTVGLYCSQAYDAEEFPKHLFYHIAEDYTGTVGSNVFVGKGGEGYVWFSTYGLAFAALQIDEDAVLAVWFGVNDPENADSYVTYMNNVSLQWGIPVYYLNVGPCYGSWAYKEPAVQEMNRKLSEDLREEITVIDVYSFIQNGMDAGTFGTEDGLHYNYETCRAIVDFAVREIDADLKSKGL